MPGAHRSGAFSAPFPLATVNVDFPSIGLHAPFSQCQIRPCTMRLNLQASLPVPLVCAHLSESDLMKLSESSSLFMWTFLSLERNHCESRTFASLLPLCPHSLRWGRVHSLPADVFSSTSVNTGEQICAQSNQRQVV